jgi:hypothetical protein
MMRWYCEWDQVHAVSFWCIQWTGRDGKSGITMDDLDVEIFARARQRGSIV